MKDSAAPRRSGFPGTVRTVARRTARTLALVLAFTLVIALGLNLDGPPADAPPPLSLTEKAQLDAEARATVLAAKATVLAGGDVSADTGSDLGNAYSHTAGLLQEHAEALRHPVLSAPVTTALAADGTTSPGPSPTPGSTPATVPSSGSSAPQDPAPTPSGFVAALFSSAQQNLDAAVTADPGIARLLASVGTSQWQQAKTLAGLQDLEVPPAATLPDPARTPVPDCSDDPPANSPEAGWLAEAVAAEHQSAYAYEVAAARSPDPAAMVEQADQHTAAAAAGEDLYNSVACTPNAPNLPAFALDTAFIDDTGAVLTALDTDLVGMYADLVGLTDGTERLWAIQRFSEVAAHRHLTSATIEAFPGITK